MIWQGLDFVTKSYVSSIKEYNETHGKFYPTSLPCKIQNDRHEMTNSIIIIFINNWDKDDIISLLHKHTHLLRYRGYNKTDDTIIILLKIPISQYYINDSYQ